MDLHIARELAAGRLVGPLPSGLREQVHTSPLGLVPKGHVAGQWQLIVDLSSPMSSSVNDGIVKNLCSLRYASMDEALDLIRALGPGTQLVKMDLKEAYRVIPVHPDDHHLLTITWEGVVMLIILFHLDSGQRQRYLQWWLMPWPGLGTPYARNTSVVALLR